MKITLCGSAKFEDEFHAWNEKLTAAGHTVYSLAVFPSTKNGNKSWYTEAQKLLLDLVHLSKIEESEAIVVLNKDGYIGESTTKEISWAAIRDKTVYYIEPSGMSNDACELLDKRGRK